MRAYIDTRIQSRSVRRVVNALGKYAPSYVDIVNNIEDAELVVIHINGRLEKNTRYIKFIDRPYAVIQYALKSTLNPDAEDWMPIWTGSELVWSYLRLEGEFGFYRAPLGVDSNVFYPRSGDKVYTVLTSGEGYLAESVREVMIAVKRTDKHMAHLGSHLLKEGVDYFDDLTDEALAVLYSACDYVSGLRRTEGFELPAAEGLMCGARPILFDRPHYKDWYDELAVFIPETNRDQIANDVEIVFRDGVRPVTDDEIAKGKTRFNWEDLVRDFWSSF